MKKYFLGIISLFSFACLAGFNGPQIFSIGYLGRQFAGEQAEQRCLAHADGVEAILARPQSGLNFVSTGCTETLYRGVWRLKVSYEADMGVRLESYHRGSFPLQQCQDKLNHVSAGLELSGQAIFESYCRETNEEKFEAMISFVKTPFTYLDTYKDAVRFSSQQACLDNMIDLRIPLEEASMRMVDSYCRARRNRTNDEKHYLRTAVVTRDAEWVFRSYDTKRYASLSACTQRSQALSANLRSQGERVLSVACIPRPGRSDEEVQVQEKVSLIQSPSPVISSRSFLARSPEHCQGRLREFTTFIEEEVGRPLYSFCHARPPYEGVVIFRR